jgi:hypothetical protein
VINGRKSFYVAPSHLTVQYNNTSLWHLESAFCSQKHTQTHDLQQNTTDNRRQICHSTAHYYAFSATRSRSEQTQRFRKCAFFARCVSFMRRWLHRVMLHDDGEPLTRLQQQPQERREKERKSQAMNDVVGGSRYAHNFQRAEIMRSYFTSY